MTNGLLFSHSSFVIRSSSRSRQLRLLMSLFPASRSHSWTAVLAAILIAAGVAGYVLWPRHRLPEPGSPRYEEYDDAFHRGLAGLDADIPDVAEPSLTRAIELIPEEPAGWANRGLFYIRKNQLDKAAHDLEQARRLAPDDPGIQQLLGILEQTRGKYSEAAAHFRTAIQGNPQDVQAIYQLAKIVDQEQKAGSDAEYQRLMEQILSLQPSNLHVILERLNRAVRRSDRGAVQDTFARLQQLSSGWSEESRVALANCERGLSNRLGTDAAGETLLLANLIRPEPAYGRSLAEVDPDKLPGTSLQSYIRLASTPHAAAPPDMDLTFRAEPLPEAPPGRWDVILPMWLTGEGKPAIFVASDKEVQRIGTTTALPSPAVSTDGVLALDWNNDFLTDLLLAGREGSADLSASATASPPAATAEPRTADEKPGVLARG
jgi:Tfp pilus assembly protein PilF